MHRLLRFAFLLIAAGIAGGAHAATAWDEASSGDLSNDGLAPTPLSFASGANRVQGTVGNGGQGIDRDYFSFVVAPSSALTGLLLADGTSVSGGVSFAAIQAGPQLTVSVGGMGAEDLLGFMHYGNDLFGTDLLPTMVFGYSGGLAAGTYSFWVQDTGGPASYAFDFVVSAVPDSATALGLGVGTLLVVSVAGRRRRGPSVRWALGNAGEG